MTVPLAGYPDWQARGPISDTLILSVTETIAANTTKSLGTWAIANAEHLGVSFTSADNFGELILTFLDDADGTNTLSVKDIVTSLNTGFNRTVTASGAYVKVEVKSETAVQLNYTLKLWTAHQATVFYAKATTPSLLSVIGQNVNAGATFSLSILENIQPGWAAWDLQTDLASYKAILWGQLRNGLAVRVSTILSEGSSARRLIFLPMSPLLLQFSNFTAGANTFDMNLHTLPLP